MLELGAFWENKTFCFPPCEGSQSVGENSLSEKNDPDSRSRSISSVSLVRDIISVSENRGSLGSGAGYLRASEAFSLFPPRNQSAFEVQLFSSFLKPPTLGILLC